MHRSRVRLAAIAFAATSLAACAKNPVTGKPQFELISEKQEIDMGRQQAQQVAQTMGLVKDDALQAYVDRVGKAIAAKTERPKLPWTFRVVDDPTVNAFSLPGGFIFVTRGLITDMNDEAQLAMVLGHEIGHATARHVVTQMSKQEVAQLGLGLGMVLVPGAAQLGQLASAGLQVLFLKFSRDDERQADDLGFRYALKDGYNVRDAIQVFQTLKRISDKEGGGKIPVWMETHPDPGSRIQTLTAKANQTKVDWSKLKVDRNQYLAQVNGVVYGENPRDGFVQGNTFMDPDLRFSFTFPSGWKIDNQAQAVVGVSPQQDAEIQVAPVPGSSPQEAAQQFASQQGVQTKPLQGKCIASGTCLEFAGQTQQGDVQGYAGFVSQQGKVLMIAAYAPSQSFGARSGDLESAMSGLHPLNDPKALSVQPAKVQLVTVDHPMTVAEFASHFPSTVPPDEVALINGKQTSDSIPAGTQLKRVTGGTPAEDMKPQPQSPPAAG